MSESALLEEQRENWGSRAGFVLAAIGSAVGLGNLWGFPYKVYANGGGAFLIPYLLAMFFIGIPLLILELSLGHMTQRAAPNAFRGINRKTEPIGWWGILLGFVIITYYPVILAWCGNYLVECVKSIATGNPLPWAGEGMEGVKKAGAYFKYTFLDRWGEGHSGQAWDFGRLVTPIVISLAVIWILMYLCIFRGVRLVSKVVLWTVPLPWIMLCILTVRGLTLPGAQQGLNFYLDPDWAMLAKPETWRWAFGQMFFSMSLAFGVMITYASFLHRKSDINNNATIIGLADVGTSFVAGIAVFATLGAMAFATQQAAQLASDPNLAVPVQKVVDGGPGLAFVAFPYALAQLPAAAWFGAVFFVALLLLGIDSAFSITESVLASVVDKTGWSRGRTLIGMSVVGFGLGLVYCTRGGLVWLGGMDEFINSGWGGIALLGLLEAVVIGWGYRIRRLRDHANEQSDWKVGLWWDLLIRYFAPVLLSVLFTWSLLEKASATGGFLFTGPDGETLNVPILVGLIVAIAVPVLSLILALVPSAGANTHAAHVGQPRHGRAMGVLGTLLVLAALAAVSYGFYHSQRANFAGNDYVAAIRTRAEGGVAPAAEPETIATSSERANLLLCGALGLSVLAALVGSWIVWKAEASKRRPSGFGRWAAGWGVMALGGAGGVLLSLRILRHNVDQAVQEATARAAEVAQAAGQAVAKVKEVAMPAASLSPTAYIVLAIMLGLLVIGLGWCFYRAIKASGGGEGAPPQLAEGADSD